MPAITLPSDTLTSIMVKETRPEKGNGLSLIDTPTGCGKTYAAETFIPKFLMNPANKERCLFFIAPQKKEIPDQERLKKAFERCNSTLSVEKEVMWVKSITDMIAETATEELLRSVPYYLRDNRKLTTLFDAARNFNNAVKQDYQDFTRDQLTKAELEFRKMICSKLRVAESQNGAYKKLSYTQQVSRIIHEEEWRWLGELYPTVFTRKRRAFLMTVDKFICPHVTLVESSFRFINDKLLEDAVVIIDEFDSSKEVLLNNSISTALRGKVDLPELLRNLHSGYIYKDVPSDLLQCIENSDDPDYAKRIFKEGQRVSSEIFSNCRLNMNYKNASESGGNDFIFYDGTYHSTTGRSLQVVCDENNKINRLIKKEKNNMGDNNEDSLIACLGEMRGAKNFLSKNCMLLASNYMQSRNEGRAKNEPELSLESALETVLDHFGIKETEQFNYMMDGMRDSYRSQRSKKHNETDLSIFDSRVYRNGVHYFTLQDSDTHEMSTRIDVCELQNTPESQLLQLIEHSRVIGMSATASLKSPMCNYDLEYLEKQAKDAIQRISENDKRSIVHAISHQNEGYGKIEIKTNLLDSGADIAFWIDLYNNDLDSAEKALFAASEFAGKKGNYIVMRYSRIAGAFRYFLLHPEIQSFLCLTTKAPGPKENNFRTDILQTLFSAMADAYGAEGLKIDECLQIISGSKGFEKKYANVREKLSEGERVFLMTAYGTAGTGVNIQYPCPNDWETVEVFERPFETNKDFDAIYVDLPTSIAPYIPTEGLNEATLLKYLFEATELAELCEISKDDYKKAVLGLSKSYVGANNAHVPSFKQAPSVRTKVTKIVNQAIGRICRTNHKAPTIHILADKQLAEQMNLDAMDLELTNPEFAALCTRLKNEPTNNNANTLANYEEKAAKMAAATNRKISKLLGAKSWSAANIASWRELREFTCKFPTIMNGSPESKHPFCADLYVNTGCCMEKYTFTEEHDFSKISVTFNPRDPKNREVSEQAARLPELMQILDVRKHFETEGFATHWDLGDLLMNPTLFNNIYLGVLGEQAGYAIFLYEMGICLQELEKANEFEKFDFFIPNTKIYVDFKHWRGPSERTGTKEVGHIIQKMNAIGAEGVIVANILGNGSDGYKPQFYNDKRIFVSPMLYDVEKSRFDISTISNIKQWIGEVAR